MFPIRILATAALLFVVGAASAEIRFVPQDSGVKVRLRGISAVSGEIAWASGREGTVLRTVDGGKHWQAMKVPGADELDFRDVEGFDADTAVVLSIGPGEASRIYRTEDGGKTWTLALQNTNPKAFFDCMAFDGRQGWMMGDPVDGRFEIYRTDDAGKHWKPALGPKAAEKEAAFAASGTCIALTGAGPLVVTGGTLARAHGRAAGPGDASWSATNASKSTAAESKGYFSAASSEGTAFLVGGDYKAESSAGLAAQIRLRIEADDGDGAEKTSKKRSALSENTIGLREVTSPRGYRSGVACHRDQLPCIAVGPSGSDSWDGLFWLTIGDEGYDAIDLAGDAGWVSGDKGRIARVEIGR